TAQVALEEERFHYADLFEFAPDGYLVTDRFGTIREANTAASNLLRAPTEFLVGKPLIVFVDEPLRSGFRSRLLQLDGAMERAEWDVRLRPRVHQGTAFDATVTAAVTRDREGSPSGVRWLIRDVTARKRGEEQIRSTNVLLEHRIAERTVELEKTVDELQRANAAKDEFL